ncbi:MAG: tRNA dihydrouridine synthase DusB [Candidatus Omnitrophica bacterium]|nr:tRNA dihydrouridine synthase DusB [Candidatus Omnitrophota bacterium]
MLRIGNLTLQSSLILAPLAGISDLPFRMLNRSFGCELAFIEMLNVRSVSFKSKKTQQMMSSAPGDRPLGVQILGCEQKYIEKALHALQHFAFDVLDFNAACPVKKVTRRGEGASLLKYPEKLHTLLRLVVDSVRVPVTVKMRIGWDATSVNAREVARAAQEAGVSAIFVHGRTKTQGYSGQVDYRRIREVKQEVSVPVIGSGDVLNGALAKRMIEETGCDGLVIARGALGNPWIIDEIAQTLKNKKPFIRPEKSAIIDTMQRHFNMCVDFYGEKNGVIIFRKFFAWYTRGFRKIRPARERVSRVKAKQDMLAIMESCR